MAIKDVIQDLANKVQAEFDAMEARLAADAEANPEWGPVLLSAESAAVKAEAMVMEQIQLMLAGDASVILGALKDEVTKLIVTNKGPVAKKVSKAALA